MHDDYAAPAKTLVLLGSLAEMGLSESAFRLLHHFTSRTTIAAHRTYCEGLVEEGATFRTNTNRLVQRRLEMVLRMCEGGKLQHPTAAQFEHLAHVALLAVPHDQRPLHKQYVENNSGEGSAA